MTFHLITNPSKTAVREAIIISSFCNSVYTHSTTALFHWAVNPCQKFLFSSKYNVFHHLSNEILLSYMANRSCPVHLITKVHKVLKYPHLHNSLYYFHQLNHLPLYIHFSIFYNAYFSLTPSISVSSISQKISFHSYLSS